MTNCFTVWPLRNSKVCHIFRYIFVLNIAEAFLFSPTFWSCKYCTVYLTYLSSYKSAKHGIELKNLCRFCWCFSFKTMQDGLNLLLQHVNITQYTNHNNLNDVSDPYRYLDLFSMAFRIRAPKWIRI